MELFFNLKPVGELRTPVTSNDFDQLKRKDGQHSSNSIFHCPGFSVRYLNSDVKPCFAFCLSLIHIYHVVVVFPVQKCARGIAAVHTGKAAPQRSQALYRLRKAFMLCSGVGRIVFLCTIRHSKVRKNARGHKVRQMAGLLHFGHCPFHIVPRGKAHTAHAGVHLETYVQRDTRMQGRICLLYTSVYSIA